MQFPFWLLLVAANPDASNFSITQFQTEAECSASKAVVEKMASERKIQFNAYSDKVLAVCEKVNK